MWQKKHFVRCLRSFQRPQGRCKHFWLPFWKHRANNNNNNKKTRYCCWLEISISEPTELQWNDSLFLFYFTENAEAESSNKISKVTTIAIIVPSLCFLIFILTAVIILRGVCKRRSQWASSSHSFTLFYAIAITNKVVFFSFSFFFTEQSPSLREGW